MMTEWWTTRSMAAAVAMGLAKMCCRWEKTRACPQPRLGVGRDAQGMAGFGLPPPVRGEAPDWKCWPHPLAWWYSAAIPSPCSMAYFWQASSHSGVYRGFHGTTLPSLNHLTRLAFNWHSLRSFSEARSHFASFSMTMAANAAAKTSEAWS